MMSSVSMGAPSLGIANCGLYPGARNTTCLSRSSHASQTRLYRVRPSPQACPTLNAQPSSLGRTTPCWLPCVRQPRRRRLSITKAALSPAPPAGDGSPVVARLGPLSLTMQDCSRYIAPALVMYLLTKCLDGKGIMLLAQGLIVAAGGFSYYQGYTNLNEHLTKITLSKPRKWLITGFITKLGWMLGGTFLLIRFVKRFIVPITVSYPFYTGPLYVLAPAAAFIKQHPEVAAACYAGAKALPPILYLAALVVSLRRAAANILGEGNATAASVNAAAGASAAADDVAAEGASMAQMLQALLAERVQLRCKVDDLAKQLSAVEDYSGDDSAQNVLLRRMGEVEGKLCQLEAMEKEDRIMIDEQLFWKLPDGTRKSRMGNVEDQIDCAQAAEGALATRLAAAEDKFVQLRRRQTEAAAALRSRLAAAEEKLAQLQDNPLDSGKPDAANPLQDRLAAAEEKLVQLQEKAHGSNGAVAAPVDALQARLAAAEGTLAALQNSMYGALLGESHVRAELPYRMDQAEEAIMRFHTALVGTGHDSGELFAAYQDGGLIERLAAAEEEVALVKRKLAEAASSQEATSEALSARLADADWEVARLEARLGEANKSHTVIEDVLSRLQSIKSEVEDLKAAHSVGQATLEARVRQTGKDMAGLMETATAGGSALQSRLSEAEEEISHLQECLGSDDESNSEDVLTRLQEQEWTLEDVETKIKNLNARLGFDGGSCEKIGEAEASIDKLRDFLGLHSNDSEDIVSKVDGVATRMGKAEAAIKQLKEQLAAASGEEAVSQDLLSRLEEAQRSIAELQEQARAQDATSLVFDDQMGDAEREIGALKYDVATLGPLDERLGAAEASLASLKKEIYGEEAFPGGLLERVGDVEDALDVLPSDVVGATALSDTEAAIKGRLSQAEETVAALTQRLDGAPCGARLEDLSEEIKVMKDSMQELAEAVRDGSLATLGASTEVQAIVEADAGSSAVMSGAAAPPRAIPLSPYNCDITVPLMKPRPAQEPEPVSQLPEAPTQAWGKYEPVTSEKIQALKRTLDTRTPSAIPFTAAETLPSAASDAGNNADGKPAAAAQLPPPVPEVIDTEEAAPYAVTEATADAAPTPVSLADISRTMSSHELAASYTKINLAAEWTPGIAAAAESAFSIHPDHMRPVVGAQLGDSVVADESLASAEEEVQNASSDEIIAAAAEAAASDKGQDIEVEEERIDYGSEEEAALEDAAADAAVDAGLVVLDDYVFNSDDVGRSLTGLKAKTKKFLDRVTPPSLRQEQSTGQDVSPAGESADSFKVDVDMDFALLDSGLSAVNGFFSDDVLAAVRDRYGPELFDEAAWELQEPLVPTSADPGSLIDVSDDEADDVSGEEEEDDVSDVKDGDVSDGESFYVDIDME